MEMIHQTHNHTSRYYAPGDFISKMPDFAVTNILDRLPLQEAVRTSILARTWRFKWTTMSQLIFDEKFYKYLSKTKNKERYERIISRLLRNLKGTIKKCYYVVVDDKHIEHVILLLSQKQITDLTLQKRSWDCTDSPLKLPTDLFSCLDLQHLNLYNCCFYPPATCHGFPHLLSLQLHNVQFESRKLGEFLTRCPMLESLDIGGYLSSNKLKSDEIAKLANLKMLSLELRNHYPKIKSSSTIFELVGSLPKLQELDLDFNRFKFKRDGAKKRITTIFPSLYTLRLHGIDLSAGMNLSCAFEMLRSFTNLQTLEIESSMIHPPDPKVFSPYEELDYNTMGKLQLRSVVFRNLSCLVDEVCLIKYILACSPLLKKMLMEICGSFRSYEMFRFARELLNPGRASPAAEINLFCSFRN